jgi:hypothetical protein
MMSNTPDVSLLYEDVRQMNPNQLIKLSKQQLTTALKNAISYNDDRDAAAEKLSPNVLKTMITDVVSQVRHELLLEQQSLISKLQEKIDAQFAKLQSDISSFKMELSHNNQTLYSEIEAEFEDRMNRRRGLIFIGVDESTEDDVPSRKAHDEQKLDDLLSVMKIPDHSSCFRIRRIGKPIPKKSRLLHVECKDEFIKNQILSNRTLLRTLNSKVFVQPDMTKRQQETYKSLQDELKFRRANGENVVIRNNKIVKARRI